MPNTSIISYTHNPEYRYYINEWTSSFAYETNIKPQPGWGYFIHRRSKDIFFEIPKNPYDGDTFAIIDVTPLHEYSSNSANVYIDNTYKNAEDVRSIKYYDAIYDDTKLLIYFTQDFQQIFTYSEATKTWYGSLIKSDHLVTRLADGEAYPYIVYGVCKTRANYANKEVTLNTKEFVHVKGAAIRVLFQYANVMENPTLNVEGVGQYPINYTTNDPVKPNQWLSGQMVDLYFDGKMWLMVDAIPPTALAGGNGSSTFVTTSELEDRLLSDVEITQLISDYIESKNITGVSSEELERAITQYFVDNPIDTGLKKADVIDIIEEQIEQGVLGNSKLDTEEVNKIIKAYLEAHDIGSGGGGGSGGPGGGSGFYGICKSSSGSIVKIIENVSGWSNEYYKNGTKITVYFASDNTAIAPSIKINGFTRSNTILLVGNTKATSGSWNTGEIIDFVFYNNSWVMVDGSVRKASDQVEQLIQSYFQNSEEMTALVNNAVRATITNEIEGMIDSKTEATINEMTAYVDTNIENFTTSTTNTINDIKANFILLETTLTENITTEITNLTTEINNAKTQLNQSLTDRITNLQSEIEEIISESFVSQIDQKISEQFYRVIQTEILASKTSLSDEISKAITDLQNRIDDSNTNLTNIVNQTTTNLNARFEAEIANISNTVDQRIGEIFSNTIDQKIDSAFNKTIDQKIEAAFEGAEGALNTAITGMQKTITDELTAIRQYMNTVSENLEKYIDDQLAAMSASIDQRILNTFNESVYDLIEDAFEATINQRIESIFSVRIAEEINQTKQLLSKEISDSNQELKALLQTEINNISSTVDERIITIYNRDIKNDVQSTINSIVNPKIKEMNDKFAKLETDMQEWLNNTLSSAVDALMEIKYRDWINNQISTNLEAVKTEINSGIPALVTPLIETEVGDAKTEIIAEINEGLPATIVENTSQLIADAIEDAKTDINANIEQHIGDVTRTIIQQEVTVLIDEKIEAQVTDGLDNTIDARIDAKLETALGGSGDVTALINSITEAKIRTAIDGEITTLIDTKLDDYIAPFIGASY